jgi:hypothetical protein
LCWFCAYFKSLNGSYGVDGMQNVDCLNVSYDDDSVHIVEGLYVSHCVHGVRIAECMIIFFVLVLCIFKRSKWVL